MKAYNFRDTFQNMIITVGAVDELKAWEFLADNFGSCYVLDNIEYLGAYFD